MGPRRLRSRRGWRQGKTPGGWRPHGRHQRLHHLRRLGGGRVPVVPAGQPGIAEAKGEPKISCAGEHHKDFADAIRQGRPAGCDFADYGGPLTEVALLAIIGMPSPARNSSGTDPTPGSQ